ncbi:MAG: SDR family oxidoreductase [Deltaproteobacteria bacterium]|nr:SDR family oxidoreductase [Deltaproteobacteria bacterium]
MAERLAVVTGGNKGIGLAVCRGLAQAGLRVVLTARDQGRGENAARELTKEGLTVETAVLDVADGASIARFVKAMAGRPVDVLVNNAGIAVDEDRAQGESWGNAPGLTADPERIRQTMETNYFGPLALCQAFVPGMVERGYGRVVNVSSGMGQLADMGGGYLGYRTSKTALNALTRVLAAETLNSGVLINTCCPGWVRTDMGGPQARLTPQQGADTLVWLATLPKGGPSGGFYRNRKPIPW